MQCLYLNVLFDYTGHGWLNGLGSWITKQLMQTYHCIRRWFAPGFVDYYQMCSQLAVASDKVYQLLAHGRWFSPNTPASSTTKTGRHDIAEILLKVALNTTKSSLFDYMIIL